MPILHSLLFWCYAHISPGALQGLCKAWKMFIYLFFFNQSSDCLNILQGSTFLNVRSPIQSTPVNTSTWPTTYTPEQGLTFCGWGFQSFAQSLYAPVVLLELDHRLCATQLHERAQLHKRAAEACCMVVLISLVLGIKIAVGHVPHYDSLSSQFN